MFETHFHSSCHSYAWQPTLKAPTLHSFTTLVINTLIKKIKTTEKKFISTAVWLKMATMASDVQGWRKKKVTSLERTLRRTPSDGAVAEAVNHVTWITQNGCSGHGSLKCIINIFQPFSGVLASLPNDGMSLEMASMLVGKKKINFN